MRMRAYIYIDRRSSTICDFGSCSMAPTCSCRLRSEREKEEREREREGERERERERERENKGGAETDGRGTRKRVYRSE